jgi:hypothetical protein
MSRMVLHVTLLIALVHIVSGLAIMCEPSAVLVSSMASLKGIRWPGALLLMIGVCALIGVRNSFPLEIRLGLIAPQQFVLVLQIISISRALAAGQFPDGYVPAGEAWFILVDQLPTWALGASHTALYLICLKSLLRGG